MPTYEMYTCPGCESKFRVAFPDPLPSHYTKHSKVKLKCSVCGEVREPYAAVLARIMQAPGPGIPAIGALEISPPDPNPPPDFSVRWHQEIFTRRAARLKAMYGN
jgi:hypothetical protein